MNKLFTFVCLSSAIAIAIIFPTASTSFAQEKVNSIPAESSGEKSRKLPASFRPRTPPVTEAAAIALLERWNNTAAPDSKGASLFELWWAHYSGIRPPGR
jgi:hypothetical protein